ncbi:MAG: hypothetical protein IJ638_00330, partial [Alphaproteobacteria bacterium]|nr:hypothetical protein [Alphaproteobacteria bacterium]
MAKTKVAVFFGGPSFEHDVSILTGLQVMQVIDITKYEPIPVYVDIDGNWWTGKDLLSMKNYPLNERVKKNLYRISLSVGIKNSSPKFNIFNP